MQNWVMSREKKNKTRSVTEINGSESNGKKCKAESKDGCYVRSRDTLMEF